MKNDISELQSALTDGKALYHKKDYNVAIQKIENILGSASNKRLLSEVDKVLQMSKVCEVSFSLFIAGALIAGKMLQRTR